MLLIDDLLTPVPGELPQGADERGSEAYSRLASSVRRARAAESSEQPPKAETWREIGRDAAAMLREKTKNLHVAAMLVEAEVRGDGFAGLEAGANLISALIDRYWDNLYPLPYPGEDEDFTAARLKPLQELGTIESMLVIPLRKRELFQLEDATALSLAACIQARDPTREGKPGHKPWSAIASEAVQTQAQSIQTSVKAIASARAAWLALDERVRPYTGGRPIGRPLMQMLEQALAILEPLVPPSTANDAVSGTGPGGFAPDPTLALATKPVRAQGDFVDREEALRALTTIAAYFRRMEPASPLAATIDDAVRRARLSWIDLMTEVIPEPQLLLQVLHRLGIHPPK